MDFITIISAVIAFLAGLGLGASGYRYLARRDPDKLERWAAEVREAKEKLGRRFE